MERTMLIGPAPSKREEGGMFAAATGRRIAGMAKMDAAAIARKYQLCTVHDFDGGKPEEGVDLRRAATGRLTDVIQKSGVDRVIFVGRSVAKDFALDPDDVGGYLAWFRTEATGPLVWMAILPHPSAVNRWYNYSNNRTAAALFLQLEIRSRGGPPIPQAEIEDADRRTAEEGDRIEREDAARDAAADG